MGNPITSQELLATLKACGYPVAWRRVTDWVAKGLLPPRVRLRRGPGSGRGALYGWSDAEVLLKALTVREALAVRSRADWASLASWFAGFDYPADRMAGLWADAEEGHWIEALEYATGGPFLRDDTPLAVDALWQLRQKTRKGRRLSSESVRVLTRVEFDPYFEPQTALTGHQVRQIFDDLPRLLNGTSTALFDGPLIRRLIPAFLEFAHEYLAPKQLAELIRTLSRAELERVHEDCRFLLTPFRSLLADATLEAVADPGSEWGWPWLYAIPRLGWSLGRMVMVLDLALRRSGYATQVDETIRCLAALGDGPGFREAAAKMRRIIGSAIKAHPGDEEAIRREIAAGMAEADESMRGLETAIPGLDSLQPRLEHLIDIWAPAVKEVASRFGFTSDQGDASVDREDDSVAMQTAQNAATTFNA